MKRIKIYRAVANRKGTMIKDLPASEKQFEDTNIPVPLFVTISSITQ